MNAINKSTKKSRIFLKPSAKILIGFIAFEAFNFGSTLYALQNILGDMTFGPFQWATILSFAFCSIDVVGLSRIYKPVTDSDSPNDVWYLFGAWFLAATFNASLTWWGVASAIKNHYGVENPLVGYTNMTKLVPIFVAAMVLLIRVLMISTFSILGSADKLSDRH
jgi:hypothetical protein